MKRLSSGRWDEHDEEKAGKQRIEERGGKRAYRQSIEATVQPLVSKGHHTVPFFCRGESG